LVLTMSLGQDLPRFGKRRTLRHFLVERDGTALLEIATR